MAQKTASRKWLAALLTVGAAALVLFLLRPSPISVEAGKVTRGLLRVTVDEDGETRAHDRFVVAAPIPGRLLRVELEEGDKITEDTGLQRSSLFH